MTRAHSTWLALPMALLVNVFWFGLLAGAQHRVTHRDSPPAFPEPHILYDALRAAPGQTTPSPEVPAPTTFLEPSILPRREIKSEPHWPLPAPRLNRSTPSVSLAWVPPTFPIAPPTMMHTRAQTTGSTVDQLPLLLSGTPPEYPAWARRAGAVGHVQLRFVVTRVGRVRDIEILHIEGDARFGPHAARKISTWRFEPARKNGRAVDYRCMQTVYFRSRP
jgi:protein TonB